MTDFNAIKCDFERDGFVVLPGYLNVAEVEELRNRAIPLAKVLMKTEGDKGRFRNLLKSLHRHDDWFDKQLTHGKHVPLMRHLLDGDIIGASAAWFDRPAQINTTR